MRNNFQHLAFQFRNKYLKGIAVLLNKQYLKIQGMQIGKLTTFSNIIVTWPHQVSIGNGCTLEHSVYFKYDGIWQQGPAIRIKDKVFVGSGCEFNINVGLDIGNNCLIASGSRFIDHDHGTKLGTLMGDQPTAGKPITVADDVWIGCNVVVLKGVNIGEGAVVAAGSVVTKSIPSREIWAGVPAKRIAIRT